MKILMLTPYLPYPPASGGQIRSLNLLKYLSRNHEITLIALYKTKNEKEYASHLKKYCKEVYLCKRAEKPWQLNNIMKAVFSLLPFLIVRNYSREARKTMDQLLAKETFDVIHAETFYIMPHIPDTSTPIILVEQTIEYKVYQHFISNLPLPVRLALSIDIVKLRYWEKHYWREAKLVATMSNSDKKIIEEEAPGIVPEIIPNGAGDEMFVDKLEPKDLSEPKLLFVGNFYWLQNTEAAEYLMHNVFPKLREKVPNATLIIAGQNADSKLKTSPGKGVNIITLEQDGSDQVKKLYSEATVFLAPIFGPGGTRLKILAAMASGLPVVSTQTGIEGLDVKDKTHVLIAETPEEFAVKTAELLSNSEKYESIRSQAHQVAQQKYSWQSIAQKLEEVYRTIRK